MNAKGDMNGSTILPRAEAKHGRILLRALLLGLAGGCLFFTVVQPWLLGWHPKPILEHGGFWNLVLITYPLFVLPFVVVAVAAFGVASRLRSFGVAVALSGAFLIPVPLLDYWRVAPGSYGKSPLSPSILLGLAVGFVSLSVLSLVAGGISAVLSPSLRRFLTQGAKTN
jgi:hypothetical protein